MKTASKSKLSLVACPSIGKENEIESVVLNQICDEFQISDTEEIEKSFEQDFMPALKYVMNFLGRKFLSSPEKEDDFEAEFASKIIHKVLRKMEQKGESGLDHFGIKLIEEGFRKKFGEPLNAAISRARNGDKEALLRLIRIDLQFLSEPWVQEIIKFASILGDIQFIKRLGKSVGLHRGLFGEIKNPMFWAVCFMKNLDLLKVKSNAELQDILEETNILKRESEEGYLSQKFRRHGLK